jgi:hypothetical protein
VSSLTPARHPDLFTPARMRHTPSNRIVSKESTIGGGADLARREIEDTLAPFMEIEGAGSDHPGAIQP